MISTSVPSLIMPCLEKLKFDGSRLVAASAVITELRTNTPRPLSHAFRFMIYLVCFWGWRSAVSTQHSARAPRRLNAPIQVGIAQVAKPRVRQNGFRMFRD